MIEKITVGSDNYKTFWIEDNIFKIHIEARVSTSGITYQQALLDTCIQRQLNNPVVMVSGGLDSELAAVAINHYTQNYTLVHFCYLHEGIHFNAHETYWAQKLADKLGKPLVMFHANIDEFLNQTFLQQCAIAYQIRSPQIAIHLACLSNFLTENVVLGGTLYQGPDSPEARSDYHGPYRLWHKTRATGLELLQDSYDLYTLACQLPHSIGRQKDRIAAGKRKATLFNSFGYDWKFIERPKHTGFELIQQNYASRGLDWNKLYRLNTIHSVVPEIPLEFV